MKLHRIAVPFLLTLAVAVVLSLSSRMAMSQQDWISIGD